MRRTLLAVLVVALSACSAVQRVNLTESGQQSPAGSEGVQEPPVIDDDGDVVAFATADYLTSADREGVTDVYVRVRPAHRTELASISEHGEQDVDASDNEAISGDGRYVAFTGRSGQLLDLSPDALGTNLYVKDRKTGILERVVIPADGVHEGFSTGDAAVLDEDGTHLLFAWSYPGIGSVGSVYVLDRTTGALQPAGVSESGKTIDAFSESTSDDARYVAFEAKVSDVVSGSDNIATQVFVRDLVAGTTTPASTDEDGHYIDGRISGWISGNGRYVALVQTHGTHHVFRKDMVTGALTPVDVRGCQPGPPSEVETAASISDDGVYMGPILRSLIASRAAAAISGVKSTRSASVTPWRS
jgi:Tol biopolymer transport system component